MMGVVVWMLAAPWAFAQPNSLVVLEDNVPPNIIARHYSNYGGSVSQEWRVEESATETTYYVTFLYDKLRYEATYNQNGRLTQEVAEQKSIPPSVDLYLVERYEKFKIIQFSQIKKILINETSFRLDIKTKTGGDVSLWFDENLTPQESQMAMAKD